MKISNDTLAILKNFASINSNVLIKPGNMVKTISPVKNVLVESHVTEDFPVVVYPDLEADDALGIYSTTHPGNIIVSPDKDLRQIPGDLYNLRDPVEEIQPDDALRWFYIQTMAGDMTDGYSGIPTVGVKRADAILEKNGCSWDTVLNAFLDKDLTKEDALMNARLAKILTKDDYIDGQIKLWDPTDASDGADAGATVQAESD